MVVFPDDSDLKVQNTQGVCKGLNTYMYNLDVKIRIR